ncbi:MAG: hypothetical protein Q7U84_07545 [Polynucleobacter sp.]|nr:hypothetical protein [Polynucleobacter sp.]
MSLGKSLAYKIRLQKQSLESVKISDKFGHFLRTRIYGTAIGPSIPVSSMLQKKSDKPAQPYKRPFIGIHSQWPVWGGGFNRFMFKGVT